MLNPDKPNIGKIVKNSIMTVAMISFLRESQWVRDPNLSAESPTPIEQPSEGYCIAPNGTIYTSDNFADFVDDCQIVPADIDGDGEAGR